jgi:hypothetical protein
MSDDPTCKRCGGRMNVLGFSRAWCMKPTEEGGCGQVFYHTITGRWVRMYRRKVARIDPIVKDKKEVQLEK